ncbi:MAG: glycosyltransferase [Candidatus Magasanikbacteria bacterium]|jgi:glycosyltransferase involved in cell wall biosynthesis
MKIVLVNKFWYPRGGAEKMVLLTKELLENAGHDVEIFGMNHPDNLFSNKYFTDFVDYKKLGWLSKIKFGARVIYNAQAKKNFSKLLADFQPEVVHFHNIYHQLSCSIIEAVAEKKIKSVMTLHDYKFISPNYNLYHHGKIAEDGVGGKYFQCLLNNCMENVSDSLLATLEAYFVEGKGYKNMINKYLSPSNFLRDKFIKAGFDAKNILCVSNALASDEFQMSDGDSGYVAYVGRLSHEKGVRYLLAVAETLPKINFKIVGDGPERAELEKTKSAKNLTNVEFVGQKSGAELAGLISGARLLVAPSVWYENAPLSILEAKARGKIVIASDIGGISEMLPAELLVAPADSVALSQKIKEWFEKGETKRQSMSVQLFEQVKKENSPEVYLQKLLKVYSE